MENKDLINKNQFSKRKGIILAGGKGSRLFPITLGVSKQLMPIYDKPMIYYPLSTLMLAGIRDFLIIVKSCDLNSFRKLLGDGSNLGIKISYQIQDYPGGIAQAFLLGEEFISESSVVLILGDNLYYGSQLINYFRDINDEDKGATIFAYPVKNPNIYGVPEFNSEGKVLSIEEKPTNPKSNYAITGIYFFDNKVIELAKKLTPSERGELEITDLNNFYLEEEKLSVKLLSRGIAWFDTGNFESLHDASSYVKTIQERQGLMIGSPEEIAWRNGWINNFDLKKLANSFDKNIYGTYLLDLISQ